MKFATLSAAFCYAVAGLAAFFPTGATSAMPWFLVAAVLVTLFVLTKDVDPRP